VYSWGPEFLEKAPNLGNGVDGELHLKIRYSFRGNTGIYLLILFSLSNRISYKVSFKESYHKAMSIGFIVLIPRKEVGGMRRIGIFIILVCFIFTGFQVAFSQQQKEEKGEYQKRMEMKLKEFKQKVEELKGKAAELKEDAKKEFNQEMKELEKKEEAANKKLKELKSASTKTWEKRPKWIRQ
jgi:uncharacterized protein HemX